MIGKIVSGGQTGVDRGALDAAIDLGIAHGGWCPPDREAEDGKIPESYHLEETPAEKFLEHGFEFGDVRERYRLRTLLNLQDSDGTLVIRAPKLTPGTKLTLSLARKLRKPLLEVTLGPKALGLVAVWLQNEGLQTLNVAGPRESRFPGIQEETRRFLNQLFVGSGVYLSENGV